MPGRPGGQVQALVGVRTGHPRVHIHGLRPTTISSSGNARVPRSLHTAADAPAPPDHRQSRRHERGTPRPPGTCYRAGLHRSAVLVARATARILKLPPSMGRKPRSSCGRGFTTVSCLKAVGQDDDRCVGEPDRLVAYFSTTACAFARSSGAKVARSPGATRQLHAAQPTREMPSRDRDQVVEFGYDVWRDNQRLGPRPPRPSLPPRDPARRYRRTRGVRSYRRSPLAEPGQVLIGLAGDRRTACEQAALGPRPLSADRACGSSPG